MPVFSSAPVHSKLAYLCWHGKTVTMATDVNLSNSVN